MITAQHLFVRVHSSQSEISHGDREPKDAVGFDFCLRMKINTHFEPD